MIFGDALHRQDQQIFDGELLFERDAHLLEGVPVSVDQAVGVRLVLAEDVVEMLHAQISLALGAFEHFAQTQG